MTAQFQWRIGSIHWFYFQCTFKAHLRRKAWKLRNVKHIAFLLSKSSANTCFFPLHTTLLWWWNYLAFPWHCTLWARCAEAGSNCL